MVIETEIVVSVTVVVVVLAPISKAFGKWLLAPAVAVSLSVTVAAAVTVTIELTTVNTRSMLTSPPKDMVYVPADMLE